MKLSTLFIINAIFALIGAVVLLFVPNQTMASYGAAPLNGGGLFLAQILGIMILGIAIMSYLAKDVRDKTALKAILTGFIIAHGGSAIFALMAVFSGLLNQMGWFDVIMHGALAGGFAYYLKR